MPHIRIEFGFGRTKCACLECAINCRFIPGYLIPADLERIAKHLGCENLIEFALENLLASPGATVVDRGRMRQIPTLVPARRSDGACKFLDANNRCKIHEVSPFGCAFFDAHQSKAESDYRSGSGLVQIDRAWQEGNLYARLWLLLEALGKVGPSPVAARARLQEALAAKKEMSSDE
ncbi:MAG: YkgJ family cysteine cluster protein [Blastocatellales bacterium]|jgi:Fe-S-cluster containining protein